MPLIVAPYDGGPMLLYDGGKSSSMDKDEEGCEDDVTSFDVNCRRESCDIR